MPQTTATSPRVSFCRRVSIFLLSLFAQLS